MAKAEKSKAFLRECIEEIAGRWQKRRITIKRRWQRPFVFVECVCEWLSEQLRNWAVLEVMQHLGHLAIIVALIMFFAERSERQKEKHYQAWQVINSAQGKTGSGGRMDALQDLNGDDVSLAGVDISNATLRGIDLEHANLREANLSGAHLYEANLSMTHLYKAKMSRVFLYEADLSGADLYEADLSGADLSFADLTGAVLYYANLADARVGDANLTGANLYGADLGKITGWQTIKSIKLANIYGVKGPPEGFIEWAKEHGALSIENQQEWVNIVRQKRYKEEGNRRGDQKKDR